MTFKARRPPFPAFLLYLTVFATGVLVERAGWLPGGPMPLLREARDLINRFYVDRSKLQGPDLEHAAIAGMVSALGDSGHTTYLSAAQRRRHKEALAGQVNGIGIRIAAIDRRATVVQTAAGSPARDAGLRIGDVIRAAEGEP